MQSFVAFAVCGVVLGSGLLASGQTASGKAVRAAAGSAKAAGAASAAEGRVVTLPVTRVSLYKNGVGFFEHTGTVTGNARVGIDFTTGQLNDVLQSLTALDLNGGRIGGAGYNSTTPLEQQLRALPLGLAENATAADFYEAIRGARVSVSGPGGGIVGRLLTVEVRTTVAGKGEDGAGGTSVERRYVTVVSETGEVRTLELTGSTVVRLLDVDLHTDVTRYLEVLAGGRSRGLRHLTLAANGTGTRQLVVSYISEVPVWKSTYRILFTDAGRVGTVATGSVAAGTGALGSSGAVKTATLQGWSVVDNTTGADWMNVRLSLVAGAPQSFIQPISVPYYTRRPEVGLPEEAQLAPQTHESGDGPEGIRSMKEDGARPQASADAMSGLQGGAPHGVFAGVSGGSGSGPATVRENVNINGSSNDFPINGRSVDGLIPLQGVASYEQMGAASLATAAKGAAFDDYFEYRLTEPITIRKNESALVPILQTKVDAERVTLWSPAQPQALRALWITNTSDLTLDRGSFSIVENDSFGGEGLLDPVHPKERRLLSYAVDQAVKVSADRRGANETRKVTHISVSKGVYRRTANEVYEVEYLVRNAAPEPRVVIVEEPVRQGFALDSDPKPEETTASLYRFRVACAAGETVRLHVGQKRVEKRTYSLVNGAIEPQFSVLVQDGKDRPEIEAQLEPVFEANRHLTDLDRQIEAKQGAFDVLVKDQARTRANLGALKGTKEERSLAQRYTTEMSSQEDQLGGLRKELDGLKARRAGVQEELSKRIEGLTVEVDL